MEKEDKRMELLKENLGELTPQQIVEVIKSFPEDKRINLFKEILLIDAKSNLIDIFDDDVDIGNSPYLFSRLGSNDFEYILKDIGDDILEKTLDNIDGRFDGFEISIIVKNIKDEEKRIVTLEKMKNKIDNTGIKKILDSLNGKTILDLQLEDVFTYNKKAKRVKIPIGTIFTEEEIEYFTDLNFSYFNEEIIVNKIEIFRNYSIEEWKSFIKFAKVLGCFSNEKMLNKDRQETQVVVGQKATTTLRDMIRSGTLKLEDIYTIFRDLSLDEETNQKFLKYISQTVGRKKFENLEMLLRLEHQYPVIFVKVMVNFEKAERYRETLDSTGKPIRVPWETALEKFYKCEIYNGITEENSDIAEVFASKGLSQEIFDEATKIRSEAREKSVPDDILGKPVKEESILDTIERIRFRTEQELESGRQIIEDLYSKKFTFEWLRKNDPQNSIIGLFASCCCSITSSAYGRDIARASVLAPDVQNLVVRDSDGNIISKGTVYVNEEEGYAVINDFELNQKYRKQEGDIGRYSVDSDSKEEQEREQIFAAFQRGIQAFIREYDLQHPDNPLKQINVGMGYNRLKRQVERFQEDELNLDVPEVYNFFDATRGIQYILYQREETEQEQDTEIDREGGKEL